MEHRKHNFTVIPSLFSVALFEPFKQIRLYLWVDQQSGPSTAVGRGHNTTLTAAQGEHRKKREQNFLEHFVENNFLQKARLTEIQMF